MYNSSFIIAELISVVCISFGLISCRSNSSDDQADLIIYNADIWTGNAAQSEAQALAVKDNSILDVGTNDEIFKFKGNSTEAINAEGKMVIPGFIDSHLHLIDGGFGLSSVQLKDAKTKEEFIRRIKEYTGTIKPGVWITNGNWDHENWGGELPTRDWIDKYTKYNPVFIYRSDGHMALANTAALEVCGVTKEVEDVNGGEIVRDKNGRLTGIFKDNAMYQIYNHIPDPTEEQEEKALMDAMEYFVQNGVTSVQNMGTLNDIKIFNREREKGKLKVRIFSATQLYELDELKKLFNNGLINDDWLKVGGLKGFVDGSLGSKTAAFFDPYLGSTDEKGFFVSSEEYLLKAASKGDSAGLQIMIHAIGDRAINSLLNIYEEIITQYPGKTRRLRIEHAQHIKKSDLPRFRELGVIASMQPYHAIDDGIWAGDVLNQEILKTTYAFRSLLDAGAVLAFGSDWPVAPAVPLEGIYAAVTRRTLDGENPDGWIPEQKIGLNDALTAYTINGAYSIFDENTKGSLEKGKLADFVILDKNIFKIPPEQIKNVSVLKTFVGGKLVFERQ